MRKPDEFTEEEDQESPTRLLQGNPGETIPTRFEKQVALYPDNIAVKQGDNVLTYAALNRAANRVAHQIIETAGIGNEAVAFLIEHGLSQVVARLGIIKAGKFYVALDTTYPRQHLAYLVDDSQAKIILTNNQNQDFASSLEVQACEIINLDTLSQDLPETNPNLDFPPNWIDTIQYTSGSTGRPKGFLHTHLNIPPDGKPKPGYNASSKDRHVLVLTAGFGASHGAIFNALLTGGAIYPYDIKVEGLSGLVDLMIKEEITVFNVVPSFFRAFGSSLEKEVDFPSLRLIVLAGETVLNKDVELFREHFSTSCTLEALLGGTEFGAIGSLVLTKDAEIAGGVDPVRYGVHEKNVFLLDENGTEVPTGEVGEITVERRLTSPGYWRRQELTDAKFIPVPGQEGVRRYHTGDLGRFHHDGCLEHLGRVDFQVKIRGQRIELAEITNAMLDIDAVENAVVTAQTMETGEVQLVAYFELKEGGETDPAYYRDSLAKILPDYMLPATYIILDQLPRTPSGKIDIRSLQALDPPQGKSEDSYVAPRSPAQRKLAEIWSEFIWVGRIGIHDNFFELGGNSLMAIRIAAKIEKVFNKSVPLAVFLQSPTIEKLEKALMNLESTSPWKYLVPLKSGGGKPPFFCIPASATTVVSLERLAHYIGDDQPFYGFEHAGMDGKSEPHTSFHQMAKDYVEEMRSLQPEGPYFLGGMCLGGNIAYEMAHQLVNQGQEVAFLGILDSNFAPRMKEDRPGWRKRVKKLFRKSFTPQKFRNEGGPPRPKADLSEDELLNLRFQKIFNAHLRARGQYSSHVYTGKITKFSTGWRIAQRATKQWEKATSGGLENHIIPGSHQPVKRGRQGFIERSIPDMQPETGFLSEPQVEVVAQKLKECLEKARCNLA